MVVLSYLFFLQDGRGGVPLLLVLAGLILILGLFITGFTGVRSSK